MVLVVVIVGLEASRASRVARLGEHEAKRASAHLNY